MYVVYVDDTVFSGPDTNAIEEVIAGLRVQNDEQRPTFELRDEGEVGVCLGIRIEKSKTKQLYIITNRID